MTTELELPAIIPITELERINATDEHLTQLIDKANELANTGATDTKSYDQIHDLTMVAVKVRTGALAIAKTLATPYKEKYELIIGEGKRIGERAQIAENITRPIKENYEAEQKRIKAEAEQAEAARIATRFNCLTMLGAIYDGSSTYNVCGVYIDAIEVKALPDNEFRDLLDSATVAYNTEQSRLAAIEAERIAQAERVQAEQKRIADEQEAERLRLKAIADEQAEEQRKFEAERAEFTRQQQEAERVRIAAEQAEVARLQKIEADRVATEQEAERVKIEIKRTEVLAIRVPQLLDLGFKQDKVSPTTNTYSLGAEWYTNDEVFEFTDEAFAGILNRVTFERERMESARIKAEADEKQAADDKRKADTERTKRLKSEKKDFAMWLDTHNFTDTLVGIKQPEMIELNRRFNGRMQMVIDGIHAELEAL